MTPLGTLALLVVSALALLLFVLYLREMRMHRILRLRKNGALAYLLRAHGRGLSLPCNQTWYSHRVFWRKEDAEAFEPEFREACTGLRTDRYDAIVPSCCQIEVVEVEVL